MAKAQLPVPEDAPVVQLVDAIIQKAIHHRASDIHFEPLEYELRIRYRIDGLLYDQRAVEKKLLQQVVARLKVLAHMNSTEQRVPQDGKLRVTVPTGIIDVRVSTFPTMYGEKVVVRILDRSQTMVALERIGLSNSMLNTFTTLIHQAQGFFLVTGPTGSGKTTTLYAALAALHTQHKNIITLEDPVEYHVPGITQGQINPDVGFTFEKGIRALLRQDPNIIMVGEIRDKQTAHIAVEAALTGHMVLSTVHTHDAPSVVMRLLDMGIEPFLINAVLHGVLAQRLARTICTSCVAPAHPSDQEKALLDRYALDLTTVYKGTGCPTCLGTGYRGRIGIFQLLTMTNLLKKLVYGSPSLDALYNQAQQEGMQTLLDDACSKVRAGLITIQEVARVI